MPKSWAQLLFTYYEKLAARFHGPRYVTRWVKFLKGLMQGCGISPTIWNAFYQVLMNYFDAKMQECIPVQYGFDFRSGEKTLDKLLFADDLVNICAPQSFWISGRTRRAAHLLAAGWLPDNERPGDQMELVLQAAEVLQVASAVLLDTADIFRVEFRASKGRTVAYGMQPGELGKPKKWMAYDPEVWMAGVKVKCFCFDSTPIFKYVGMPLQADAGDKLINAAWIEGIHVMVAKIAAAGLTPVQTAVGLSMWLQATQAWEGMTVDPPDSLVTKAQAEILQ